MKSISRNKEQLMTDYKFSAKKRERSAKECRRKGYIPAVLYGKKVDNINLELETIEFVRVFREAGTSNLIDIKLEDGKTVKTLIQDIQRHSMTGNISHIDFYKVDMKEKIKTEIPLEFVGENDLIIQQEGTLITNKDAVEVECLPSDLVDHIDVNIATITDWDSNIKVEDIQVPTGIEILDDTEEVVALIQPPRSEEELAALDEEVVEDLEAIEVENAGDTPAEEEETSKEDKKA